MRPVSCCLLTTTLRLRDCLAIRHDKPRVFLPCFPDALPSMCIFSRFLSVGFFFKCCTSFFKLFMVLLKFRLVGLSPLADKALFFPWGGTAHQPFNYLGIRCRGAGHALLDGPSASVICRFAAPYCGPFGCTMLGNIVTRKQRSFFSLSVCLLVSRDFLVRSRAATCCHLLTEVFLLLIFREILEAFSGWFLRRFSRLSCFFRCSVHLPYCTLGCLPFGPLVLFLSRGQL